MARTEGSISGFTYEQIEEMHRQVEEARSTPLPEIDQQPTPERRAIFLFMQALAESDDSRIVQFFSEDRFHTLIMIVQGSVSLGKKLVTQIQYIEETNDEGVVVARAAVGRIQTLLNLRDPNPTPELIIIGTRPRIITNGYRIL